MGRRKRSSVSPKAVRSGLLLALAASGASAGEPAAVPEPIAAIVRRAGNGEDEAERYRLLKGLEARPDLDPALRAEIAALLPAIDDWANGRARGIQAEPRRAAENGYLCGFFTGKARPAGEGKIYPPEIAPSSPLHPVWCLYRGRMLIWQVIQSGPLLNVRERREAYWGEARRLLETAARAFPENRVIGMYLGKPIPWPQATAPHPAAPEWASLQREGLEKLHDIIRWWIAERQLPDGQFGGGWGDDVEMWRWWTPVLIAFQDPFVEAAQERLSEGIFRQPHLKDGFTSRVTDVEHSNEDTTDTILPMMHLRPDDPLWRGRALRLAELMRDRWTGRNGMGFLQFRSIYFSVDRVDEKPERAFDTVYHPTAIEPALLLWQRTGDRALGALFGEWLKLWVDATARAGNGKPAGILPSAVRWPDGAIGFPDHPWWQPFSQGHNDALYNWPGAARHMTSTLLLARHLLGDDRYLEPIRSMAAIRLRHMDDPTLPSQREGTVPDPQPPAGSEAWCAGRMGGFLPDALGKLRLLGGGTEFDRILRADGSGAIRYRLDGDLGPLVRALRRNAEAFRTNREAYTFEMRWTDRVLSFTRNYLAYLPDPPPTPQPEILYSTATGDPGNPIVLPLNAVRWLTLPREIAALVDEGGPERFAARLFHFGSKARPMGAELYLLRPGNGTLVLEEEGSGKVLDRREMKVEGRRAGITFELPPGKLCRLRIEMDKKN